MKIAVVVSVFPKISETFIISDLIGLIQQGHEVDILAFCRPKKEIPDEDILKYKLLDRIHYFDLNQRKPQRMFRALGILLWGMLRNPKAVWKILGTPFRKKCEIVDKLLILGPFLKKKYDIVHCHFGVNAVEVMFLKNILNFKLVTTFHGYDISSILKRHGNDFYEKLFKKGDLFLPVSGYFRKRLIELGCPEEKIKVQYCGVDITRFPYVERKFDFKKRVRILTIGRLVEKKGVRYSILAVSKLLKQISNIEYTIIGAGSHLVELQMLVKQLGLENKIKFLGNVVHDKVKNYIEQSDIFILPSVTAETGDQEGIPVVLKEAMATGIPVVSTTHAGIPELITHGKTGILAEEKDIQGLVKAIGDLIQNPDLCKQLGLAGRKVIEEEFNSEKLNRQLTDFYSNGKNGTDFSYWQKRSNFYYYQVTKEWIEEFSPGNLIMDVGSRDTPMAVCGNFKHRIMLDIKPFPKPVEGVEQICSDWLKYNSSQSADLVLCLQVLEHLPDYIVKPFARKLIESGKNIIVSVPYMWDSGTCSEHIQDPVDLKKLVSWIGEDPVKYKIEDRDKHKRLIAVFKGKGVD